MARGKKEPEDVASVEQEIVVTSSARKLASSWLGEIQGISDEDDDDDIESLFSAPSQGRRGLGAPVENKTAELTNEEKKIAARFKSKKQEDEKAEEERMKREEELEEAAERAEVSKYSIKKEKKAFNPLDLIESYASQIVPSTVLAKKKNKKKKAKKADTLNAVDEGDKPSNKAAVDTEKGNDNTATATIVQDVLSTEKKQKKRKKGQSSPAVAEKNDASLLQEERSGHQATNAVSAPSIQTDNEGETKKRKREKQTQEDERSLNITPQEKTPYQESVQKTNDPKNNKKKRKTRSKQKNLKKDRRPENLRPGGADYVPKEADASLPGWGDAEMEAADE